MNIKTLPPQLLLVSTAVGHNILGYPVRVHVVASFRITAPRATPLPRRRLMRLYHSRSRRSFLSAW